MSPGPGDFFHLSVSIVRSIHAKALARFGGTDGVREIVLLESSVAAPQAAFQGRAFYADLPEMAAAYLYFICRSHPFVDGNKRTALGACLVFLRLNGIEPDPDGPEWEKLVLSVAGGQLDREASTEVLRGLLRYPRSS